MADERLDPCGKQQLSIRVERSLVERHPDLIGGWLVQGKYRRLIVCSENNWPDFATINDALRSLGDYYANVSAPREFPHSQTLFTPESLQFQFQGNRPLRRHGSGSQKVRAVQVHSSPSKPFPANTMGVSAEKIWTTLEQNREEGLVDKEL